MTVMPFGILAAALAFTNLSFLSLLGSTVISRVKVVNAVWIATSLKILADVFDSQSGLSLSLSLSPLSPLPLTHSLTTRI